MSRTSVSWVQPSPARRLLVRSDADDLAVRAVPDRDAVAPPQLARDAPVVQVVDPVEVPLLHLLRVDLDPAVADRVTGGLGERADLDPPLHGQTRLDRGLAARAVADGVGVRALLGDDPALGAQRADDRGTGLEPVQALERAVRGDDRVLVHDGEVRQAVALADLEVVRVVGGRHLDRAGAELGVDVLVGDDRDPAAGERQLDLACRRGARSARRRGGRRPRCHRASSRRGSSRRRSTRRPRRSGSRPARRRRPGTPPRCRRWRSGSAGTS